MSTRDPQYKPALGIVGYEIKCGLCQKVQAATNFNKNRSKKSGYQSRCRVCEKRVRDASQAKRNKQKRLHYALNKELISRKRQEKYRTNSGIADFLYKSAKARAKRQKVPFALDKAWVEQIVDKTTNCPLTGQEFQIGHGISLAESRTLDKIIVTDGYTHANTLLVSHKANSVKNNGSLRELEAIVSQLEQLDSLSALSWVDKVKHFHWRTQIIMFSKNGYQTPLTKSLFHDAKKRAKKKDISFSLHCTDIVIPVSCPLLELDLKKGKRKQTDFSPSLDRIDNTKGYIPTNIQVISCKANRMKNDCSIEELRTIVKNWRKIEEEKYVQA